MVQQLSRGRSLGRALAFTDALAALSLAALRADGTEPTGRRARWGLL